MIFAIDFPTKLDQVDLNNFSNIYIYIGMVLEPEWDLTLPGQISMPLHSVRGRGKYAKT